MAIRSHTKKEVLHASIQGVLGNVSMPTKIFRSYMVIHGGPLPSTSGGAHNPKF